MNRAQFRHHAETLLAMADVHPDGLRTTGLAIHDNRVFAGALAHGTLGFVESHMDRDWDTVDLPGLVSRLLSVGLDSQLHGMRSAGCGCAHVFSTCSVDIAPMQ